MRPTHELCAMTTAVEIAVSSEPGHLKMQMLTVVRELVGKRRERADQGIGGVALLDSLVVPPAAASASLAL